MKPKKYLPVTYVDEDGVVWTKEQLQTKTYKKHETETIEQHEEWGTYIHTIRRISQVRKAPRQLNLF